MQGAILQGDARTEARALASLEPVALAATRAAGLACQDWTGRGSGKDADRAATEAMRAALSHAPGVGRVVVGDRAEDAAPMQLTFSDGRALQATPLKIWAGEECNASAAQKSFAHRAHCTGEARAGRYSAALEHELATA